MYRAIALYLLREKVKPDDTEAVSNTCTGAEVTLIYQNGEQAVLLNGENVNGFIRTEEVGNMASRGFCRSGGTGKAAAASAGSGLQ